MLFNISASGQRSSKYLTAQNCLYQTGVVSMFYVAIEAFFLFTSLSCRKCGNGKVGISSTQLAMEKKRTCPGMREKGIN